MQWAPKITSAITAYAVQVTPAGPKILSISLALEKQSHVIFFEVDHPIQGDQLIPCPCPVPHPLSVRRCGDLRLPDEISGSKPCKGCPGPDRIREGCSVFIHIRSLPSRGCIFP